jgi:Helix-turn-helix domain
MSLQDTVLAMTVAVMDVAKTGRDALIDELIAGGLTGEEAQTVVDDVILVRLGPGARKAKVQQLHDAGMSQRQIAAEIGVDHRTVGRDLGASAPSRVEPTHEYESDLGHLPQPEPEVIEPGDPADRAALDAVVTNLSAMRSKSPAAVAASVPPSYVTRTRAELKRVHQWMGEVIVALDRR